MPMPPSSAAYRASATAIVAMLAAGCLYAACATVRFYGGVFALPAARGANAAIDESLQPVGLDARQLRDGVGRAGWPADSDIVVLGAVSGVPVNDLTQAYYSASYLLYPRRLWMAAWCDDRAAKVDCDRRHALSDASAAVQAHHARRVMVVGTLNPFRPGASRPLSDRLSLVDLE
jgi:hypothetical protein